MPRCSYNSVFVLCPADHTVCRTVFATIQRICFIQEVKATDCRRLSSSIFNVIKFILKVVRTTIINFLLTRDDVFAVNTCQIVHQGLCFRCCILVCQVTRRRKFRIIRFGQSQIVELCPAPVADKFQFIFASIQFDSSNI